MPGIFGDDVFSPEEIAELLNGLTDEDDTPPQNVEQQPAAEVETAKPETEEKPVEDNKVDTTKAFAKRLKESTDKARLEEREALAKSFGYESYENMMSERQKKIIEDNGLDPDEVSPIIDKLVKEKLDNDPRMKELAELRKKQVEEFGKKELADITQLTGGAITKLEQVPKDVIELWKTKGSLKAAYIELHGEELIMKARSEQSKGSTAHLSTPEGNTQFLKNTRPLTQQERDNYKFFNPLMTNEELDKIRVKK